MTISYYTGHWRTCEIRWDRRCQIDPHLYAHLRVASEHSSQSHPSHLFFCSIRIKIFLFLTISSLDILWTCEAAGLNTSGWMGCGRPSFQLDLLLFWPSYNLCQTISSYWCVCWNIFWLWLWMLLERRCWPQRLRPKSNVLLYALHTCWDNVVMILVSNKRRCFQVICSGSTKLQKFIKCWNLLAKSSRGKNKKFVLPRLPWASQGNSPVSTAVPQRKARNEPFCLKFEIESKCSALLYSSCFLHCPRTEQSP